MNGVLNVHHIRLEALGSHHKGALRGSILVTERYSRAHEVVDESDGPQVVHCVFAPGVVSRHRIRNSMEDEQVVSTPLQALRQVPCHQLGSRNAVWRESVRNHEHSHETPTRSSPMRTRWPVAYMGCGWARRPTRAPCKNPKAAAV